MKTGTPPPGKPVKIPGPCVPAAQALKSLLCPGREVTFTWGTSGPLWMPPPGSTPALKDSSPNSAARAWSGPHPTHSPKGPGRGPGFLVERGRGTPAICRPQAGAPLCLAPGPDSACAADKAPKGPASRASQRRGVAPAAPAVPTAHGD